ncbi:MAG: nucleoside-diphosphate sugar epimerase/dehydratase [Gaiellaceae bacterium]
MNLLSRHRLWQLAADGAFVAAAWFVAFWLAFDLNSINTPYDRFLGWKPIVLVIVLKLAVFVAFGFYNRWWRYVSTRDIWTAAAGVTIACVVADLVVYSARLTPSAFQLPRRVMVTDWLFLLAFITGSRTLARTLIERPLPGERLAHGKEVLIAGAGDAASVMLRELHRYRHLDYTPIGLVDDDPRKQRLRLHGVKVLGTISDLPLLLRGNRPDEVLIAMPSASGQVRQRIVEMCREASVPVKTLPGLYELFSGELTTQIRPVQVEDVLGREPIEVNFEEVAGYLAGQTVVVTGAGGSIGSELCRQIARVGPKKLLLVEQGETPLFEIDRELRQDRGFEDCVAVLADAGQEEKMRPLFAQYRPQAVFHAAAFKHVPLMEANPLESVRNNALATRSLARVARDSDVERFVLISTDKAVTPQTVMGQSKALCEWIVEALGSKKGNGTKFIAVRFGNVLGSSGSVIPIFRRQIEKGGPVTVTDPEMTRYFMTIPEAVSLVVQAGGMGSSGQVFVLDMGKPVKILELAQNMIRLSGKEPGRDIEIVYSGIRPGEKLHEELWGEHETVSPTKHPKIRKLTCPAIDPKWLDSELAALAKLVAKGDADGVVTRLARIACKAQRLEPEKGLSGTAGQGKSGTVPEQTVA